MHPNVRALLEIEFAAQKSEEWLALRGNMLTASDAATAIGKNKYDTPEGLLLNLESPYRVEAVACNVRELHPV